MNRLRSSLAFARGEMVATLRQPGLLLSLVLGPFLVLFVFGLGYERDLPALSTLVVGSDDSEITARVDEFIRTEEPAGIDYRGTTPDREPALARLRDGDVDLVVVLPDAALDTLERSEQAVIEVHQRSLDPVTYAQIAVAADQAVAQINDRVLEGVVAGLQEEASGIEEQLAEARRQLDALQRTVDADDVARLQDGAARLADQLDGIAATVAAGGGAVAQLGLDVAVTDVADALADAAARLRDLSAVDATGRLEDASSTLDELTEVVEQLGSVEPGVVVRPFEAEIVSQAPIEVTLDRFYAPGLVALMLQHVAVTFAALALVRERQRRTTAFLAVTPARLGDRLAGKAIAFLVFGAMVAAVLTALVIVAFGVPAPADWLGFVALVGMTLLASIGIGFLVAALARTDSQAVQFSMLVLLAAIFFAGLFMPLDRIAVAAQAVSWSLPATHAFAGLQDLQLLGRPAAGHLYAGLAAIFVVTTTAALFLLPRRLQAD